VGTKTHTITDAESEKHMKDISNRISVSLQLFQDDRETDQSSSMTLVQRVGELLEEGLGVEILMTELDGSRWSDSTKARLKELCNTDLAISAHANINEWDPGALRDEIRLANEVGVGLMVVHPYPLGVFLDERPVDSDEVRGLCDFARDHGVLLALENLGVLGMSGVDRIFDIVGSDPAKTGLGVCIDTGHAWRSFHRDRIPPVDFFRKYSDIIYEVHLNDNEGTEDLHLVPGDGTIDWEILSPEIRNLNNDTIICLELKKNDDPGAAMRRSRRFVLDNFT
jgi:sugar phosphate isomerase/epimerase